MKNTFGTEVTITLFGESHGEMIGVVIDGLAPGIPIDEEQIRSFLTLRRPAGRISTQRREQDQYQIVSGYYQGKTTGTSLTIVIPNEDKKSKDYEGKEALLRPSHADYTAYAKYHGFQDPRGGGHFSGRLTAALVAGGAIAVDILQKKNILIGTHILQCGDVRDQGFETVEEEILRQQIQTVQKKPFPVLNPEKEEEMQQAILAARADRDSLGGILQTGICGLPAGLGEPFFDSVESRLAHMLFSIPGVKGVDFGTGFGLGSLRGSIANDPWTVKQGKVKTKTNHSGGINGGITNGMPVIFKTAMRPTPSIGRPQQTVNFKTMEAETLEIKGRHDPAIFHRAKVVVDTMTAFVLLDMITQKEGTDWMRSDMAL